jgi:hypothetical protein
MKSDEQKTKHKKRPGSAKKSYNSLNRGIKNKEIDHKKAKDDHNRKNS